MPEPIFLESTRPDPKISRWSIFAASPLQLLTIQEGTCTVQNRDGRLSTESVRPASSYQPCNTPTAPERLRRWLAETLQPQFLQKDATVPGPFSGGVLGWVGYDFGWQLERLPKLRTDPHQWPELQLGLYDTFIVYDHKKESGTLVAITLDDAQTETATQRASHWLDALEHAHEQPERLKWQGLAVSPKLSPDEYRTKIRKVLDYIQAGDIFQANFTHRFEASGSGDPLALYENLARISPAPFAAYTNSGEKSIICSSPEWFYRIEEKRVVTRPIKGTRPRGSTPEEDAANQAELLASAKDRAELTMIVDLERNDLGRVCQFGSVKVNHALTLESYAQVHHLVAEVEGNLRDDCDVVDLLVAMFPGGSITGAPKIRAMEIIEELESDRRGVYTGAIGYIGLDGRSAWNIPIRTIVRSDKNWSYNVGGGIVADSDPDDEYRETLTKGRGMKAALETPYP